MDVMKDLLIVKGHNLLDGISFVPAMTLLPAMILLQLGICAEFFFGSVRDPRFLRSTCDVRPVTSYHTL